MPMYIMYILIEYGDNYSKTLRSLWQFYKDKPALNSNDDVIDFPAANNNSASFNLKLIIQKLR